MFEGLITDFKNLKPKTSVLAPPVGKITKYVSAIEFGQYLKIKFSILTCLYAIHVCTSLTYLGYTWLDGSDAAPGGIVETSVAARGGSSSGLVASGLV